MTPGLYTWTWGSGKDADSFRLIVAGGLREQLASLDPPSVPEPATWTLMALGFGLLGLLGYRKTRSDNALA